MGKNIISKTFASVKNVLMYEPDEKPALFLLRETEEEKNNPTCEVPSPVLIGVHNFFRRENLDTPF